VSKKFLVVDDETVDRSATASSIKQVGFNVELATSGLDALKKFIANHYDVILMDDEMPFMDGLQCTKKIREYEAGTSKRSIIIGVTSNNIDHVQAKFLEAGMDACFEKNASKQELQRTVRQWALIA
jgi:CheY-like chemotaxis protein